MNDEAVELLRIIATVAEKYGLPMEAFMEAVKELGEIVRGEAR